MVAGVVWFAVVVASVALLVPITPQDPDSETGSMLSHYIQSKVGMLTYGDETVNVWEVQRYNSSVNTNKSVAVPPPPPPLPSVASEVKAVVKDAAKAIEEVPLVSSEPPLKSTMQAAKVTGRAYYPCSSHSTVPANTQNQDDEWHGNVHIPKNERVLSQPGSSRRKVCCCLR